MSQVTQAGLLEYSLVQTEPFHVLTIDDLARQLNLNEPES